jgi:hypothetical protein
MTVSRQLSSDPHHSLSIDSISLGILVIICLDNRSFQDMVCDEERERERERSFVFSKRNESPWIGWLIDKWQSVTCCSFSFVLVLPLVTWFL